MGHGIWGSEHGPWTARPSVKSSRKAVVVYVSKNGFSGNRLHVYVQARLIEVGGQHRQGSGKLSTQL